ncbi:MAG: amino acid ABC transporter substrate-binding protein [Candidatus Dormibacteraceae bacterium]
MTRYGNGKIPVLIAGLAVVLSACGLGSGTQTANTNTSKPILVGLSEPLTGDKADIGTNSDQGYKTWAAEVNATGGILGRKVKLITYDNNSLADTAVSQYQKLITSDKVDVLLGPVSSALVTPTEAVAARYNKIFVEGTGGAPSVFQRHFHDIFFVQPAPAQDQADPLVNWIKSLPAGQRPTKAAYVTNDDPFASAVVAKVKTAMTAMGIPTVFDQVYPPTQTDFTTIGAQIKAKGADLLVQGSVADQDAIAAVQSYSRVGFQPTVAYFASGPDSANTWKAQLGAKGDGSMTSLDWLQQSSVPGNSTFTAEYLKLFPNKDNVVPAEAAEAYGAGQVLAAAIKATGTLDNAKLIKWLHGHKVQSIEGNFGWDSDGRPVGGSYNLIQWQNGHLNTVWPPAEATNHGKPTIPKPNW